MIRIAVALALLAGPAIAQEVMCAPLDVFRHNLEKQYAERPTARGIQDNGMVMEILSSLDGTYTILMIRPSDGLACIVASGKSWGLIAIRNEGRGT
jgi:hypothetical protein